MNPQEQTTSPDGLAELAAQVMNEPPFVELRPGFVARILERAGEWPFDDRILSFIGGCAGGEFERITALVIACVNVLKGSPRDELQRLAEKISGDSEFAKRCLEAWTKSRREVVTIPSLPELPRRRAPVLQLALGNHLAEHVTQFEVNDWLNALVEHWGVPLPACVVVRDSEQLQPNQARLLIHDTPVSTEEFSWDQVWLADRGFLSPGTILNSDGRPVRQVKHPGRGWPGVWIPVKQLKETERSHAEQPLAVMRAWFAEILRRDFENFFDRDLAYDFLRVGFVNDQRRIQTLLGHVNLETVRQVLVNLVHERLRLDSRQRACLDQLQALSRTFGGAELLSEKLRISFSRNLCEEFATSQRQLSVIALRPHWEKALEQSLIRIENQLFVVLSPNGIQRLVTAMTRSLEQHWHNPSDQPVLVCGPGLRLPLFRLLEQFDRNFWVLSYAELIPDIGANVVDTLGGEQEPLLPEGMDSPIKPP